jgi:hypothetical protein
LVIIVVVVSASLAAPVEAQIKGQVIADPRFAETPILTDRFNLSLGGYLIDFDSQAAVGFGSGVGSIINLEELLGLDTSQQVFRLDGMYRFNRHNSIAFTYYGVRRTSSGEFEETIDFLDLDFVGRFEAETTVNLYAFTYRRSFVNNGRTDAGMSFGLSTFDMSVGLEGEVRIIGSDPDEPPLIEERGGREGIIAPVPTLGMFIDHALSPRWILRASAGFLDLDIGDYSGRYIETQITVDFFVSKHVGVGGGLSGSDIKVSYSGDDPFRFDYRFSGFVFYLSLAY